MSVLKKLLDTVTASSEEDIQLLLDIMNPTEDRDEMGDKFIEAIGYDPITYFDRKDMERAYDKILRDDVPSSIIEKLEGCKNEIIDAAMTLKSNTNISILFYFIASEIALATEYSPLEAIYYKKMLEEFPPFEEDEVMELENEFEDEDDEDEFEDEDE